MDGNKGGSGEGETDMDVLEKSDDERDDRMAIDDKVNKGQSSEVVIIMQGNSGEPDIECGDAHMQVVERGNSEGGREDGEGEDMSGDDQAIDMDTGEEVSESEDAEEVSHKPRALPKIPKRKGRWGGPKRENRREGDGTSKCYRWLAKDDLMTKTGYGYAKCLTVAGTATPHRKAGQGRAGCEQWP